MTDSEAFELSFARNSRDLFCMAAGLMAFGTLGLGALSIYSAIAGLVAASWLARQAVLCQRRCDSIHARALAAELAEGTDDPETWAEAA